MSNEQHDKRKRGERSRENEEEEEEHERARKNNGLANITKSLRKVNEDDEEEEIDIRVYTERGLLDEEDELSGETDIGYPFLNSLYH